MVLHCALRYWTILPLSLGMYQYSPAGSTPALSVELAYTMLFHTIYHTKLCYTILYNTILYYTILHCTKLYYFTILCYAILCTMLCYTIIYCTVPYYYTTAPQRSRSSSPILDYTILYRTVLYYTTTPRRSRSNSSSTVRIALYYTLLYYGYRSSSSSTRLVSLRPGTRMANSKSSLT